MSGRHLRFGFALVSLLAGTAEAEERPRLAELVARYGEPTVGGDSAVLDDVRFSAGHLSLILTGRATPVRAGDDVVGFFFRGKGSLEYQSADPIEFPVLSYNVRKNSSLDTVRAGQNLGLRDSFEEALWISAGLPLPPLSGSGGGSLADAFQRHRSRSTRVSGPPLSHGFALARIDAPAAARVFATFFGGKEDFVYVGMLQFLTKKDFSLFFEENYWGTGMPKL